MLHQISLSFGPNGKADPLLFDPQAMTVFVGPNSSGKSLALREIEQFAQSGPNVNRKIVDQITLRFPTRRNAEEMIRRRITRPPPGQIVPENHVRVSWFHPTKNRSHYAFIPLDELINQIEVDYELQQSDEPSRPWHSLYNIFASLFTVSLDGKNRFALTERRPMGDLLLAPENVLAALFQDDESRNRVRQLTAEAFDLHFVIDPTEGGQLRPRWSMRQADDSQEEQALDDRARAFHQAALGIDDVSDGIKAFTGLVCGLLCSDFRIMLVDEPEAFLHPTLARNLGIRTTDLAAERGATVIAATHSADFLMGCVEAGHSANIVRLTYDRGVATARILASETLQTLMRDPLLRSTGPLSALFHSGAVVCESDSDQAFYREINWRLEAAGLGFIRDSIFLRAQNKQTIRRIVRPLREMGIPAAAIVDIDIVKGGDLAQLCLACAVPEATRQGMAATRGNLERDFRDVGVEMRNGGITLLKGQSREAAEGLFAQLAAYGIFVVPNGEVESWLPQLDVQKAKSDWLIEVFEKMGSDPASPNYVRPQEGDVWAFLRGISEWVADPNRRGMP